MPSWQGVTAGIVQPCACSDLTCVLPLGVAFSRAGKLQHTWDGHGMNAYLSKEDIRAKKLQREGCTLFGNAC